MRALTHAESSCLTRLHLADVALRSVLVLPVCLNRAAPEELDVRVKPYGSPDLPRDESGDLIVPDNVQRTFDAFDADGSGDIDFSELRQALAQMGMDGDRKATAVLLRRYDSDGGGLSIQEFTMLVADIDIAHKTGYLMRGVQPAAEKGSREVRAPIGTSRAGTQSQSDLPYLPVISREVSPCHLPERGTSPRRGASRTSKVLTAASRHRGSMRCRYDTRSASRANTR